MKPLWVLDLGRTVTGLACDLDTYWYAPRIENWSAAYGRAFRADPKGTLAQGAYPIIERRFEPSRWEALQNDLHRLGRHWRARNNAAPSGRPKEDQ